MKIAGIDYGSKLAGTTVVAVLEKDRAVWYQSAKKKDADAFLLEQLAQFSIQKVFLDAPLSLPGVYRDMSAYDDFFYRKADKDLRAMSPMFLGGLTARAMRLQRQLQQNSIETREVYPAHLAKLLQLKALHYKQHSEHIAGVASHLANILPFTFDISLLHNWHQIDALLALYSAWRYEHNEHLTFGIVEEGQIIV